MRVGYNLRYAALIVCCVLAIVVAAAFFPAAGYGDAPDREAVESDHYTDTEGEIDFGIDLTPSESNGTADDTGETDDESDDESDDEELEEETEEEEDDDGSSTDSGSSGSSSDSVASGLVAWLLLVGAGIAGVLVLAWRFTTRKAGETPAGELPDGVLPAIRFRLRRIPQLTMAATIGASRTAPALLDGVARSVGGAASGLGAVTRDVGRGVGAAAVAVPTALAATSRGLGSLPSLSLSNGVSSLIGGLRTQSRSRSSAGSDEPQPPSQPDAPAVEEPQFGPRTIEDAWEEMTATVPISRKTVRTPGEYARAAIDAGLPAEPVAQLTEAFREVRYGDFPPSPDRTRRARDAFDRLDPSDDDEGGESR